LDDVPLLFQKYEGKEGKLLKAIEKKYADATPVAPAVDAPKQEEKILTEASLRRFYEKHCPEKVDRVGDMLKRFSTDVILEQCEKKYNCLPDLGEEGEEEEEKDETMLIKEQIEALYKEHAPEQLENLDMMYQKYEGKEAKFLKAVEKKFGASAKPAVETAKDQAEESGAAENQGKDPIETAYIKTFRDRIVALYKTEAPEKIAGVDALLAKYYRKEAQLLSAIEKKYGVQSQMGDGNAEDDEDDEDDEGDEGDEGKGGEEDEGGEDKRNSSKDAKIEAAFVKYFQDRIEAIYKVHAPDKIGSVEELLGKYKGNEPQLLAAIEKKYGITGDSLGAADDDDEDDDDDEGALATAQKAASKKVKKEKKDKKKKREAEEDDDDEEEFDPTARQTVIYCEKCGLPPEYCEYGPYDLGECDPEGLRALNEGEDGDDKDQVKSKRKDKAKQKKRIANENAGTGGAAGGKIILQKALRNKRKNITVVTGLETYGVKLKAAAKVFSKAFAASSSVSKSAANTEEIQIQGDVLDQIPSVIIKEFKVGTIHPSHLIVLTMLVNL
jgi:density-regulated protein DRP1